MYIRVPKTIKSIDIYPRPHQIHELPLPFNLLEFFYRKDVEWFNYTHPTSLAQTLAYHLLAGQNTTHVSQSPQAFIKQVRPLLAPYHPAIQYFPFDNLIKKGSTSLYFASPDQRISPKHTVYRGPKLEFDPNFAQPLQDQDLLELAQ